MENVESSSTDVPVTYSGGDDKNVADRCVNMVATYIMNTFALRYNVYLVKLLLVYKLGLSFLLLKGSRSAGDDVNYLCAGAECCSHLRDLFGAVGISVSAVFFKELCVFCGTCGLCGVRVCLVGNQGKLLRHIVHQCSADAVPCYSVFVNCNILIIIIRR